MKHWLMVVVVGGGLLGAASVAPADAARPEDRFFDAAAIALDADLARSQADWARAHARYTNALAMLEQLRAEHPAWNPAVVDYRVRAYRRQLDNLALLLDDAAKPPRPPAAAPPEPAPEQLAEILAAEARLAETAQARRALEQELERSRREANRLTEEKVALQSQLEQAAAERRAAAERAAARELADLRSTFMELGASLNR